MSIFPLILCFGLFHQNIEVPPVKIGPPAEAIKKLGERFCVEFEVGSTGGNNNFYINSEKDFKDPSNFTVILPKPAKIQYGKLKKVEDLDKHFAGKKVRVTGVVKLFEGKPRIQVDDPEQIVIVNASPAIPGLVSVKKNISYLAKDRKEFADLYLPASEGGLPRPGIVIIHGGGWTGGDKGAEREINIGNTLASHGYVCISINYLLQKEGNLPIWPQNLNDCKMAVRWLRANSKEWNVDPKNIGVIGGSAGGHLAALVGLTGDDPKWDPAPGQVKLSTSVQAVVDLYGPMAEGGANLTLLLGKTREEAPELYRQISPFSHIDAKDPPFLIIHGTGDKTVPLSDSERFAGALKTAGVAHELLIIPGAPHSFHLQPKEKDLRPIVLGFLDKHLKPNR